MNPLGSTYIMATKYEWYNNDDDLTAAYLTDARMNTVKMKEGYVSWGG